MAFMDKDFLLESNSAKTLYHDSAANMPIIDYHCHINASDILENKRFVDLSEAWLGGDHYKWRLMRANGIAEKYITGDASGFDKFIAFAEVLPRSIGNPVYHWAHLELQRFFGCAKPLDPDTAREIWDICNEKLKNDDSLCIRGIIEGMRVEVIVTTNDPADDLDCHKKLSADDSFNTKVLPGWRPGAVMDIENVDFTESIAKLGKVSDITIEDFYALKSALNRRMEYFNDNGCRTADYGIAQLVYAPATDDQLNTIFKKRLSRDVLTPIEANQYRYSLMRYCAREHARLGWVMELHLGAIRNVNTIMFDMLGPDTGFDCAATASNLADLVMYFDELDRTGALPKTLIFSINPADNMAINTLAGCFTEEGIRSKLQQGSAWWFNDTYTGIKQQIVDFAESGVLANFVGMLTDSRSFLSYTRHEYFRRILCNIVGNWVDSGRYPADWSRLDSLVKDVCYYNSKTFFNF